MKPKKDNQKQEPKKPLRLNIGKDEDGPENDVISRIRQDTGKKVDPCKDKEKNDRK